MEEESCNYVMLCPARGGKAMLLDHANTAPPEADTLSAGGVCRNTRYTETNRYTETPAFRLGCRNVPLERKVFNQGTSIT